MTDTTGPTLSERLRKHADYWTDVPGILLRYEKEREEAAAALDAQAAMAKELAEALEGVVRVADRKTNEFDAARAALTKYKAQP